MDWDADLASENTEYPVRITVLSFCGERRHTGGEDWPAINRRVEV